MANKRAYLLFEDVQRDFSLRPLFDACVAMIQSGKARVTKTRAEAGYVSYDCFLVGGREILIAAPLEYYLSKLGRNGFVYEDAKEFSDIMRKLCGWKWDVDRVLRSWIERVVQKPFFEKIKDEDGYPLWKLKSGEPSYALPEDFLRFACYIAICHVKFGASEDSYTAKEIFSQLTSLGSDLPAKLKKYGSDLPKEVAEYSDGLISCKANDVFSTIKIVLKEESEEAYQKSLDFLCRLLEYGFPKSYTIDFRSPEKNWLPIKGLAKKGVHQLFANAVSYPALHDKIAQYARLAMNEFEWYDNLEAEHCAMPGTFAVFALGLLGEKYHALVCDYLKICDGEHQSVQGDFVLAYIERYGFTEKGLELYDLCEKNIQHLPKKLVALYKKRALA
jgi:hypothetical protein